MIDRDVLEHTGDIVIPSTDASMVARENFTIGIVPGCTMRIQSMNDNFTEWFLSGEGLVEGLLPERTIHRYRLRVPASPQKISDAMGCGVVANATLSDILFLMRQQEEQSVRLNPAFGNSFHIADQQGIPRSVTVVNLGGFSWSIWAGAIVRSMPFGPFAEHFSSTGPRA